MRLKHSKASITKSDRRAVIASSILLPDAVPLLPSNDYAYDAQETVSKLMPIWVGRGNRNKSLPYKKCAGPRVSSTVDAKSMVVNASDGDARSFMKF